MMRALLAVLLLFGAIEATAGTMPLLQSGPGAINSGPSPGVPSVTPGAGWAAGAVPANPGPQSVSCVNATVPSCGANDNVNANWDAVPFDTFSATRLVCVIAVHNQGIQYVQIGVDGGSMVNAVLSASGPAATATDEYCVTANPSTWTDGNHEFRAVACPNTGICRVLGAKQAVSSISCANPTVVTQPAYPGYGWNVQFTTSGVLCTGMSQSTNYLMAGVPQNGVGIFQGSYRIPALSTSGTATGTIVQQVAADVNGDVFYWTNLSLYLTSNTNGTKSPHQFYVSPSGTDSGACGASGSKCLTINQAIVNMGIGGYGGSTVYLDAGSYGLCTGVTISSSRKTGTQWLTISPSPGTLKSAVSLISGGGNSCYVAKTRLKDLNITGAWSLGGTNSAFWLDNVTAVGPSQITYYSLKMGGGGTGYSPPTLGMFSTDSDVSNYVFGMFLTYGLNSNFHDTSVSFNGTQVLVNSQGSNLSVDEAWVATTNANTVSGNNVLHFPISGAGSLYPLSNTATVTGNGGLDGAWIVGGGGTRPACVPSNAVVSAFDLVGGTVTMNVPTTCQVNSGTSLTIPSPYHGDYQFTLKGSNNQLVYGNTATSNIYGEIYYHENGVYLDNAVINSNLGAAGSFQSFLMKTSSALNLYVRDTTFAGTNSANNAPGGSTYTDTVLDNVSCPSTPFTPFTGITVINPPGDHC